MFHELQSRRLSESPRVLLPNQGRLHQFALDMLEEMELTEPYHERRLCYTLRMPEGSLMFVRSEDVPGLLEQRLGSVGVTGLDYVLESGVDLDILGKVSVCPGHLALQVDVDSPVTSLQTLPEGGYVVSQYPEFTRRAVAEARRTDLQVTAVSGAAEAFVNTGLADASVDVICTGETARANRMKIAERLASTSAVVVRRREAPVDAAFDAEILRLAQAAALRQTQPAPVAIVAGGRSE